MTVLIGLINESGIVLAADNRITKSNDDSFSDNYTKLFTLHDSLALAIGGNVTLSTMLIDHLRTTADLNRLYVENTAEYILDFLKNPGRLALCVPKCCAVLIGGKGGDGHPALLHVVKSDLAVSIPEPQPCIICPPDDVDQDVCYDILRCSFETNPNNPFENTIGKIAGLSKYVSFTGNKWIYQSLNKKSVLLSF